MNVPLPPATTDAGYLLAFDEIVAPIVRGFRPDLIFVAAGQDASVFDPTGRMLVSAAGFRDARGARRGNSRTSSPAGDSWSVRRVVTARSTTRSASSPCSRGSRARAPAFPTHGTTTPPCSPPERRPTTACEPPSPRCAAPSRAGFRDDPGRRDELEHSRSRRLTESRSARVRAARQERAQDADDLLDIPWWKAWSWSRRPWDSEARKSLARIKTSLETARVWHDQGRLGDHEKQFERVLERPLTHRSLDNLIELVYALDELLVIAGDAEFVHRRRLRGAPARWRRHPVERQSRMRSPATRRRVGRPSSRPRGRSCGRCTRCGGSGTGGCAPDGA